MNEIQQLKALIEHTQANLRYWKIVGNKAQVLEIFRKLVSLYAELNEIESKVVKIA